MELISTFGIVATVIIIGSSIGATFLCRKVFKRIKVFKKERIPAFESDAQSKPKSESSIHQHRTHHKLKRLRLVVPSAEEQVRYLDGSTK